MCRIPPLHVPPRTVAQPGYEAMPTLTFKRGLVRTVACIPLVLLMGFLSPLTTRIRASSSGQWVAGAT